MQQHRTDAASRRVVVAVGVPADRPVRVGNEVAAPRLAGAPSPGSPRRRRPASCGSSLASPSCRPSARGVRRPRRSASRRRPCSPAPQRSTHRVALGARSARTDRGPPRSSPPTRAGYAASFSLAPAPIGAMSSSGSNGLPVMAAPDGACTLMALLAARRGRPAGRRGVSIQQARHRPLHAARSLPALRMSITCVTAHVYSFPAIISATRWPRQRRNA